CPPVSGHSSLHLLLISSAKQGALPSRSRTEQDAPTLVWLAPGAGGGWPISGRYKEEVEGRMARDRGTWRKSATRRPRPRAPLQPPPHRAHNLRDALSPPGSRARLCSGPSVRGRELRAERPARQPEQW